MNGLRLDHVTKAYGDTLALDDVTLGVSAGEVLAVLGPSGCGKTTLLRLIAGLEPLTRGRVEIAGRDVTAWSPGRRDVAMVFQSYALFPHLDVAGNIGFGLTVRDTPRAEIGPRVQRAAELVGCEEFLDRRPHELSGGERQRVALARALVREPEVFLFDEPLSNLDAELRVRMRGELRDLHRRVGKTTVHVTHDQTEAMLLGDRIAVLRGGVVQQVGTPDEVWRTPANRFVARFVGTPTMNLLPADGPLRIDGVPARPGHELGVRPDHLVLGHGGPWSVTLVERVGADAYVHLSLGAVTLVARTSVGDAPAVGSTVSATAARDHAHVFDVRTGTRVP